MMARAAAAAARWRVIRWDSLSLLGLLEAVVVPALEHRLDGGRLAIVHPDGGGRPTELVREVGQVVVARPDGPAVDQPLPVQLQLRAVGPVPEHAKVAGRAGDGLAGE